MGTQGEKNYSRDSTPGGIWILISQCCDPQGPQDPKGPQTHAAVQNAQQRSPPEDAVLCRASFSPCHLPNPATFSLHSLRLCDILVTGLLASAEEEKADVRLVMLGTSRRRLCKCIQKEARGVPILAECRWWKFLT